jgi:hypothetical protein
MRYEDVSWWYDRNTDRIYNIVDNEANADSYYKARSTPTQAMAFKYIKAHADTAIPPGCLPATGYIHNNNVYVTGIGKLRLNKLPSSSPLEWILESVMIPPNIKKEFMYAGGTIQAVSDGSFKEAYGMAAWILHITDNCVIHGDCIAPGEAADQSAYHSKLTGLYGIACTVWTLQHKWNLRGSITAGCDGISALRQAQKSSDFIDPNLPQFDLIMAIRKIISQTVWHWEWIHVKGHQDKGKPIKDLDCWSQWNVQMDAAAEHKWLISSKHYINPLILGEPWRTEIDGKKVTSNIREKLRETCTMTKATEYWDRKERFGSQTSNDIDWDALGTAMYGIPTSRQ